jgi:hypothetical protein
MESTGLLLDTSGYHYELGVLYGWDSMSDQIQLADAHHYCRDSLDQQVDFVIFNCGSQQVLISLGKTMRYNGESVKHPASF